MKKYALILGLILICAGLQAQETVSGNRYFMGKVGLRTKTPGRNVGIKGSVRYFNDTTGAIDIRIPTTADTFMLTLPASVPSVENEFVSINPSGSMVNKKPNLSQLGDVDVTHVTNGKTIYYHSASGKWRDTTFTAGTGTVTSVAMTVPTGFTVSGSPVTTSGTLAVGYGTVAAYGTLINNSSSTGTPSFQTFPIAAVPLTDQKILVGNSANRAGEYTVAGDLAAARSGANVLFVIEDNAVDGTDISLTGEVNGDLMYFNGTNWVRLGVGTSSQYLKGGTVPEWGAIAVGDLPTSTQDTTTNSLWRLNPSGYLYPRSATRVGIGTSAPAEIMSVVGNITIPNLNYYKSGVNNILGQENTDIKVGFIGGSSNTYLGVNTSKDLRLVSGGTTMVTVLNTSGNLGLATTSPSYIFSIGGNSARTIGMERHTTANTAGNNLTLLAGGATSGATDKNGGDNIISGGTATGTGSSNVLFYTTTAGATGTTDRTPTEKMRLTGSGSLGLGITPTSRIHLYGNKTADTLLKISNSKTGNDSTLYMYSNGEVVLNGTDDQAGVLGLLRVTEQGGGVAIQGESQTGTGVGLAGYATAGSGLFGTATTGEGVYGASVSGWAGKFVGKFNLSSITEADTAKYTLTWNKATGEVKAQREPGHFYGYYSNNTGFTRAFASSNTYYPLVGALTFPETHGFTGDNDSCKVTYNYPAAHIKHDINITMTGTSGNEIEVQLYNVTDAAEVPTSQLATVGGTNSRTELSLTCYDVNASPGDVYQLRMRNVSATATATIYRIMWFGQVTHY